MASAPVASSAKSISSLLELEADPTLFSALDHLSGFYPARNDETARQNLLGNIERNSLNTHRKFLESFGTIHTQLSEVENAVKTMRKTCNHMQTCLDETNGTASRVISRTQQLQHKKEETEKKLIIVGKYLEKFQLTTEERNLLTGAPSSTTKENSLSIEFFKALKRVQEINTNAKEYLRSKYPHAEIAIRDSLSLTQQAAYDTLYRWIQAQFKDFYKSSPEIEEEMTLAIQAIHERPVLLQNCLEGIMDVRSSAVYDAFMDALQRGGPNGIPKPIEIHAHDPFRYVGDMLGCIHQLLASEIEFLHSLFYGNKKNSRNWSSKRSKEGKDRRGNHGNHGAGKYDEKIEIVLARTIERVGEPFQVRVEQVLVESSAGFVVLFRLANLLDFYARTIATMIPLDSPLVSLHISECKRKALAEFYRQMAKESEKLLEAPPSPPASLSPPSLIHHILNNLMEIMAVFDSSLVPQEEREREFTPILLSMLEPLLKTCILSATVLTSESDMAVFLINCLGLVQNSLGGFSFSSARGEELQGQIDAHMETLVTEEARNMLRKCKLGNKLEIFQDWEKEPVDTREPLSYVNHMDTRQLSEAVRSFEESLLDIVTTIMPQCEKLFSSRFKSLARKQVHEMIIGAYTSLFESVMDPKNKYESPQLVVPYKPEQLRTMLSN